MKKRIVSHGVTHEEISIAMKQFLSKGGQIRVLPKQEMRVVNVIGADKWDAYESLMDLSF